MKLADAENNSWEVESNKSEQSSSAVLYKDVWMSPKEAPLVEFQGMTAGSAESDSIATSIRNEDRGEFGTGGGVAGNGKNSNTAVETFDLISEDLRGTGDLNNILADAGIFMVEEVELCMKELQEEDKNNNTNTKKKDDNDKNLKTCFDKLEEKETVEKDSCGVNKDGGKGNELTRSDRNQAPSTSRGSGNKAKSKKSVPCNPDLINWPWPFKKCKIVISVSNEDQNDDKEILGWVKEGGKSYVFYDSVCSDKQSSIRKYIRDSRRESEKANNDYTDINDTPECAVRGKVNNKRKAGKRLGLARLGKRARRLEPISEENSSEEMDSNVPHTVTETRRMSNSEDDSNFVCLLDDEENNVDDKMEMNESSGWNTSFSLTEDTMSVVSAVSTLFEEVIVRKPKLLYRCRVCAKGFNNQSDLEVHGRMHSGEKPYICPKCGDSFVQEFYLQYHFESLHHGTNTLSADKPTPKNCLQESNQEPKKKEQLLKVRDISRSPELSFTSPNLDSRKEEESVILKLGIDSIEKNGIVEECNSTNRDESGPFSCPYCDKDYDLPCALIDHLRIPCDDNLEDSSSEVNDLESTTVPRKYKKRKSGEATWKQTKVKEQSQKSADSLKSKEKGMFECKVCGKKFVRQISLRGHMRIHKTQQSHTGTITSESEPSDGPASVIHYKQFDLKHCEIRLTRCDSQSKVGEVKKKVKPEETADGLDSKVDIDIRDDQIPNAPSPTGAVQQFQLSVHNSKESEMGESVIDSQSQCEAPFQLDSHKEVKELNSGFQSSNCNLNFFGRLSSVSKIKNAGENPSETIKLDTKINHKASLKQHNVNIHGAATTTVNLTCVLCKMKLSNEASLDEHIRVHTGEKPYFCSICGRNFAEHMTFEKHFKKVHRKTRRFVLK